MIRTRTEGSAAWCVLHLKGDGTRDLILKRVFGPDAAEKSSRSAQAHRIAATALDGQSRFRVPKLVAHSASDAAILISRVPGKTAEDHLLLAADNPQKPSDILHRVGQWLATYHLATQGPPEPFDTKWVRRRLDAWARDLSQEDLKPTDADAFSRCIDAARAEATDLHGTPLRQSIVHSDFHTRNVLLAPDRVSVIDLENIYPSHPARDVASFLMSYGLDHRQDTRLSPGLPVPVEDAEAFFSGYDMPYEDPTLGLFMRMRLLKIWAMTPHEASQRSIRVSHRYKGLSAMVPNVFPEVRQV